MPSRQRTREGVKRPSRVRHDQGYRADGSVRPAAERHRARNTAARGKRKGAHSKMERLERPFHGIAGEGAGDGEGYALVALRSGEHVIRSGPLTGDAGNLIPGRSFASVASLDFGTCMAFLAATIPDGVQPVCWELDWLTAMMCKSLPREKLAALVDREGRCPPDDPWRPRPVVHGGIAFDWLPHHYFSFRTVSGRSIHVSDPHRFFGRELREGLDQTGIWPYPETLDLEWRVRCLEVVMERFRAQCIKYNVVPRQWEGPGQGASRLMSDWGIKDHLSGSYVQ